jgi:hypothetical protein
LTLLRNYEIIELGRIEVYEYQPLGRIQGLPQPVPSFSKQYAGLMARQSERLKVAVSTAVEMLQSPQKIRPALKAQLCELILRLETVEIERREAREQRAHELKLAELKAIKFDVEAEVNKALDVAIQKARAVKGQNG